MTRDRFNTYADCVGAVVLAALAGLLIVYMVWFNHEAEDAVRSCEGTTDCIPNPPDESP